MIKQKALNHKPTYYYKINKDKLDTLEAKKGIGLKPFLEDAMKACPHEKFLKGPRSSQAKKEVEVDIKQLDHEVKLLARLGLESDYYSSAHMNVQMFMLGYDSKTVSIETPVWMNKDEQEKTGFFASDESLTGHIDLVRIEDDKIWIWDYKPDAHKEKHAHVQTFLYALMLSKRTNIPLSRFRCGYFDEKNVYAFNPSLKS